MMTNYSKNCVVFLSTVLVLAIVLSTIATARVGANRATALQRSSSSPLITVTDAKRQDIKTKRFLRGLSSPSLSSDVNEHHAVYVTGVIASVGAGMAHSSIHIDAVLLGVPGLNGNGGGMNEEEAEYFELAFESAFNAVADVEGMVAAESVSVHESGVLDVDEVMSLEPVRLSKGGANEGAKSDHVGGYSMEAGEARRLGDNAASVIDSGAKSRSLSRDFFSFDVPLHERVFLYMKNIPSPSPIMTDSHFDSDYFTLAPVPAPTPMPAPTTPRPTFNQADLNQQAAAAGAYTSGGTVGGECRNCAADDDGYYYRRHLDIISVNEDAASARANAVDSFDTRSSGLSEDISTDSVVRDTNVLDIVEDGYYEDDDQIAIVESWSDDDQSSEITVGSGEEDMSRIMLFSSLALDALFEDELCRFLRMSYIESFQLVEACVVVVASWS